MSEKSSSSAERRRPFRFRWRPERVSLYVAVLTSCVGVGTAALAWIGYRAIREWESSTKTALERRADEVLALLAVALNRDMKGVQMSVLVPINHHLLEEPPFELAEVAARAFARFPYPESFFAWKDDATTGGTTYFFNRADRRPVWDTSASPEDPYPVSIVTNPVAMRGLVEHARSFGQSGSRFALFESKIGATTYQTAVHLIYGRPGDTELAGVIGFTVNVDWVRREYFAEILRQVHLIGGPEGGLSLSVIDDSGRTVAAVGAQPSGSPVRDRQFPLVFFEPTLLSSLPPGGPPIRRWIARVNAAEDPTLIAANAGATRTLLLISVAAFATFAALILVHRAVRASAQLAVLKSDFVSTVTHELKTPLALIRLVSETLAKGRYNSQSTIQEYAGLLSNETTQLTRLIDNLLTCARFSELTGVYSFETLDIVDVVEDSLDRFRPRLFDRGFDVACHVPTDLPPIKGDRTMLGQVFDNLIDNAIKYAGSTPRVSVSGRANGHFVHIEISDMGQGIPDDELPQVFDKFFRGRHAKAGGSGLGLAIARQVIRDHGGNIAIRREDRASTIVDVALPTSPRT